MAFVSFVAAAVAAWFSAGPPAAAPAKRIAGISSPGKSATEADETPDTSPAKALAAAERALAEEFDSPNEHFTGERLAELCLADTIDLAGQDLAARYARRWAMKSPREMYEWFQRRGSFDLPGSAQDIIAILFTEWAKQDAGAAMQAALKCCQNCGGAMRAVVSAVQRTDPTRAVALLAEHLDYFRGGWDLPLSAKDFGYRATWEAINQLPAGRSRSVLLASYFNDLWTSRREESVRIWQELPAVLRAELVTGSFTGVAAMRRGVRVPQPIPRVEGIDEMRRSHVETTGDAAAAAHFVASRSGREWAQRDPAAAVTWAQQYLKGEAGVKATAQLFCPAAAQNFDAALQALEALPPGVLRVRALDNLAAGASTKHAAEVEALLAALPGEDRRLVDVVRRAAASDEKLRALLKAAGNPRGE
jgi:hypothetical protein